MGSSYASVTLLGVDSDMVGGEVIGPAFITVEGDVVVVFAHEDEGSATSGRRLSAVLECVAFSVSVLDSDLLAYSVHHRGHLILNSMTPDPMAVFGFSADDTEFGTGSIRPDAAKLVRSLGRGQVDKVAAALLGDFVFAEERHQALLEALGLPAAAAGWGYEYLHRDRDEYSGSVLTEVNR